jgi:hypothetical protein
VADAGSREITTNLLSSASHVALRGPPVDLFDQPTELNGILAFIPGGVTIRITCPSACCRRTIKLRDAVLFGVPCSDLLGLFINGICPYFFYSFNKFTYYYLFNDRESFQLLNIILPTTELT